MVVVGAEGLDIGFGDHETNRDLRLHVHVDRVGVHPRPRSGRPCTNPPSPARRGRSPVPFAAVCTVLAKVAGRCNAARAVFLPLESIWELAGPRDTSTIKNAPASQILTPVMPPDRKLPPRVDREPGGKRLFFKEDVLTFMRRRMSGSRSWWRLQLYRPMPKARSTATQLQDDNGSADHAETLLGCRPQ